MGEPAWELTIPSQPEAPPDEAEKQRMAAIAARHGNEVLGPRCWFALAASLATVLLRPAAAGLDDELPVAATAPAFGGCPSARTHGTVGNKPDGRRTEAGFEEE